MTITCQHNQTLRMRLLNFDIIEIIAECITRLWAQEILRSLGRTAAHHKYDYL
jgi:hypothetical protein